MSWRAILPVMWANGGRRLVIATAVATAAVLVLMLSAAYVALRPAPYDPLGDYPVQVVNSTVDGVAGPAVLVGHPVSITGIKCNDTARTVTLRGHYEWRSVSPAGTTVSTPFANGSLPPGCTTRTFENPMPPSVVARSREVFARTGVQMVWQITGINIPYTVDGQAGEPRLYQSANFTVVVP